MANKTSRKLTPSSGQLNAKQGLAAELIAAGHNITETAKKVGVRRETIHAWGRLDAFQAAIKSVVVERRGFARLRLEALVEPAIAALAEDLTNKQTTPALRQKAALAILDRTGYASRMIAQVNLDPGKERYNLDVLTDEELDKLIELQTKAIVVHPVNVMPSRG